MRGPGGRQRHRAQRLWQCPVCQRREYTDGHVVHRLCDCRAKGTPPQQVQMRLIEEPAAPAKPSG